MSYKEPDVDNSRGKGLTDRPVIIPSHKFYICQKHTVLKETRQLYEKYQLNHHKPAILYYTMFYCTKMKCHIKSVYPK